MQIILVLKCVLFETIKKAPEKTLGSLDFIAYLNNQL
jgi:hypothetical protein